MANSKMMANSQRISRRADELQPNGASDLLTRGHAVMAHTASITDGRGYRLLGGGANA